MSVRRKSHFHVRPFWDFLLYYDITHFVYPPVLKEILTSDWLKIAPMFRGIWPTFWVCYGIRCPHVTLSIAARLQPIHQLDCNQPISYTTTNPSLRLKPTHHLDCNQTSQLDCNQPIKLDCKKQRWPLEKIRKCNKCGAIYMSAIAAFFRIGYNMYNNKLKSI